MKIRRGRSEWRTISLLNHQRVSVWFFIAAFFFVKAVAGAQSSTSQGLAKVEGIHLTRDGQPWIPHGFHQIAFAVAPGALSGAPPFFGAASRNYTPQEYLDMREHGADSVRIQVAQNGIDRNGSYYSREFEAKVIGAVHAARQAGLTVIISIQNEEQTGEQQKEAELPTAATERVWRALAPVFAQDHGVLFELFNEPRIQPMPPQGPSSDQWQAWAAAMNRMIAVIRSLGAGNVVIADGLQRAETLHGAPKLSDRAQQVVYAAHPYAHSNEDQLPDAWKWKFGDFSSTAPVIISEWGIGYYCDIHTPKQTERFLLYIQDRSIGLEIVTWDWASPTFGSFNYGFPKPKISSFEAGVCSGRNIPAGFGVGEMVDRLYKTGSPSIGPSTAF